MAVPLSIYVSCKGSSIDDWHSSAHAYDWYWVFGSTRTIGQHVVGVQSWATGQVANTIKKRYFQVESFLKGTEQHRRMASMSACSTSTLICMHHSNHRPSRPWSLVVSKSSGSGTLENSGPIRRFSFSSMPTSIDDWRSLAYALYQYASACTTPMTWQLEIESHHKR